ncbi:MAG: chorismate mutase [Rhodospirillales bacterium]|nr:chorismate mutase [Rhodospirillales bacterium]
MSSERTLAEVRSEIDSIDDAIQDLLIRRTQLVSEVRVIKHDWRVKIQPSREAEILYRLVKRHSGAFPKRDLVAIWRVLICATLSFEGPFSVAVYTPANETGYWDLARDHFGPCTPVTRHTSVRSVIEAVHRQDAIVGVLPMPRLDDTDPWWRHIVTSHPEAPRIIARLPFVDFGAGRRTGAEALAICPVSVVPTGRDRSYLVAETEERLGLNQFTQALQEAGLTSTFATVWRDEGQPQSWLYLSEVDGSLATDDARLDILRRTIGKPLKRLQPIGGYALPIPPDVLGPAPAAAPQPALPARQPKSEDSSA